MGHEFMGIVEEVGSDVKNSKKGDRAVVCFDIGCGKCFYCQVSSPTTPRLDQLNWHP